MPGSTWHLDHMHTRKPRFVWYFLPNAFILGCVLLCASEPKGAVYRMDPDTLATLNQVRKIDR